MVDRGTKQGVALEIRQKSQSYKADYVFEEDRLRYAWQSNSGSRSFSIGYGEISRDRESLVERNAWLRNAGLLWIAIGLLLTIVKYTDKHEIVPSMWLFIGAGCYVAYRVREVAFTVVPTEKGNMLVIRNPDGERILREIETRRADYLRREYDFVPEGEGPEHLRRRFKWLHGEGALTDHELEQRLQRIDASDPAVRAVQQMLSAYQKKDA
jgi:hypothetical protein